MKKKPIKILKKRPVRFYKSETEKTEPNRTEPTPKKTGKKPSQTGLNRFLF